MTTAEEADTAEQQKGEESRFSREALRLAEALAAEGRVIAASKERHPIRAEKVRDLSAVVPPAESK
ncbi:hypothetical protein [Variovorax sp. YR216]|uniref:hypothetical protein n=1 Tax=Variovorax sp. YR216 TaxID=1882828 RepID=UPI0008994641|nr:hypothetical protein [Variovorax sp. YR216]SEB22645.1 hypothetical protein SAMN05444680_116112 [Variovorax sp. YR216]